MSYYNRYNRYNRNNKYRYYNKYNRYSSDDYDDEYDDYDNYDPVLQKEINKLAYEINKLENQLNNTQRINFKEKYNLDNFFNKYLHIIPEDTDSFWVKFDKWSKNEMISSNGKYNEYLLHVTKIFHNKGLIDVNEDIYVRHFSDDVDIPQIGCGKITKQPGAFGDYSYYKLDLCKYLIRPFV